MKSWDIKFNREVSGELVPHLYYPVTGYLTKSETLFRKTIEKGNLLNPVLVSLPENIGVFMHPLELPAEFASVLYKKALRDRIFILRMAIGYCLFFGLGGLFFVEVRPPAFGVSATLAVASIYLYLDYRSVFLSLELLRERCRYYGWIFLNCRAPIIAITCIFLVSGTTQFVFGDDKFLNDYALAYELPEGEYWRLLTGSLIHSGIAHWLTNFSMGVAIAAICGPVLRKYFIPILVLGGVISFYLTFVWNGYHLSSEHDGLVGTSGGLAALLGSHLMLCAKYKSSYPRHFGLTVLYFVLISLIAGAIFLERTSLACHIFGLFAGGLIALLVPNYLEVDESTTR